MHLSVCHHRPLAAETNCSIADEVRPSFNCIDIDIAVSDAFYIWLVTAQSFWNGIFVYVSTLYSTLFFLFFLFFRNVKERSLVVCYN